MATKRKMDTSDKAYIENYPPLDEWLKKHEARCAWQQPMGGGDPDHKDYNPAFVECWVFPKTGRHCIITVQTRKHGWEIYTPGDSNKIDLTLEDAEKRLGL